MHKYVNKSFKSIIAVILLLSVLVGLCGCGKAKKSAYPQLNTNFKSKENIFSFSIEPSQVLKLSNNGAKSVGDAISQIDVEYAYSDMYNCDEVKKRLNFDASVKKHTYSALDKKGDLTADSLKKCVTNNNAAFMAKKPFGYTAVEDDYIEQLCEFIVEIIDSTHKKYPDIDWQRVYCNLGNLKILYNVGMLSYAQVSDELILSISKNNTTIVLNMKGEDGFSRVLTHEIMHIIQIGCECENIENCVRRAGIAVYWEDFSLNTTDWTWMVEGSAERLMCNLTGGEAISYQYKMDYLCSMTLSVLLRDSVKADTMETISFYDDPQLLFDAFGCETEAQRDELLNMMITLQVLQMQPQNFHIAYQEKYGVSLLEDDEAMNQFSYSLKPAVCITLAKEFYENLLVVLQKNQMKYNDLFFLINLFEGHLYQHLTYTDEAKKEVNQPFIDAYNSIRNALFSVLERENGVTDIAKSYVDYVILNDDKTTLNAELSLLNKEKREFLLERAQWQFELGGLGKKVPFK